MVGGLRDVITCAEFQIEIFMGYDFTGGRIFDFPIDFSMGLTTVQRYCAACDCYYLLVGLLPSATETVFCCIDDGSNCDEDDDDDDATDT